MARDSLERHTAWFQKLKFEMAVDVHGMQYFKKRYQGHNMCDLNSTSREPVGTLGPRAVQLRCRSPLTLEWDEYHTLVRQLTQGPDSAGGHLDHAWPCYLSAAFNMSGRDYDLQQRSSSGNLEIDICYKKTFARLFDKSGCMSSEP